VKRGVGTNTCETLNGYDELVSGATAKMLMPPSNLTKMKVVLEMPTSFVAFNVMLRVTLLEISCVMLVLITRVLLYLETAWLIRVFS
jgi:hypothetical protein